jgi:hypothetical protein
VAVALLLLAGCPRPHTGGGDEGDAIVIFHADVPEAALWVDGRYIGPIGSLKGGVQLSPGPHRFELRDDAHFSHYAELVLEPRDRKVLEVHLAPILP